MYKPDIRDVVDKPRVTRYADMGNNFLVLKQTSKRPLKGIVAKSMDPVFSISTQDYLAQPGSGYAPIYPQHNDLAELYGYDSVSKRTPNLRYGASSRRMDISDFSVERLPSKSDLYGYYINSGYIADGDALYVKNKENAGEDSFAAFLPKNIRMAKWRTQHNKGMELAESNTITFNGTCLDRGKYLEGLRNHAKDVGVKLHADHDARVPKMRTTDSKDQTTFLSY